MNLVEQIWRDKKTNKVNPTAFSDLAQVLAKKIDQEGLDKRGRPRNNKSTQIRKFYDVVFGLNQRAKVAGANWNAILAQLHRQLALVHYAKGRDLVTDSFVKMMDELIKAVEKKEDLQVVTDFLEAFMAFYKERRRNN